jgi:uncharacterized membrane protein YphA (DoxX/SURF4 family)
MNARSVRRAHAQLADIDRRIASWMARFGHPAHRVSLGVLFIWLGLLKQFGVETGTSLIARSVYWGPPDVMVPLLGWWEVAIGACLLFRPLIRVALLLLAVRLPGTALALVLHADATFDGSVLSPTPTGQFLIKDLMLFSAALVIGGTVGSLGGVGAPSARPGA